MASLEAAFMEGDARRRAAWHHCGSACGCSAVLPPRWPRRLYRSTQWAARHAHEWVATSPAARLSSVVCGTVVGMGSQSPRILRGNRDQLDRDRISHRPGTCKKCRATAERESRGAAVVVCVGGG